MRTVSFQGIARAVLLGYCRCARASWSSLSALGRCLHLPFIVAQVPLPRLILKGIIIIVSRCLMGLAWSQTSQSLILSAIAGRSKMLGSLTQVIMRGNSQAASLIMDTLFEGFDFHACKKVTLRMVVIAIERDFPERIRSTRH